MERQFTTTIKMVPADVERLLTEALTKSGDIKPGDQVSFRFTTQARSDYMDRHTSYDFGGVEVTIIPAKHGSANRGTQLDR